MQTAIQVICTGGPSLRALIAGNDRRLDAFGLKVAGEKRLGRNPGWMKVQGTERGIWGALNISWDTGTRTLTCRVVNRQYGTPHLMIGRFIDFLLRHHSGRIKVISIFKV